MLENKGTSEEQSMVKSAFKFTFSGDAHSRLYFVALCAMLTACGTSPSQVEVVTPVASSAYEEVPTEALNPDVHQNTIQQTICVPGYTASVRPSTSFTEGVKGKLLREQSLPPERSKDYELDHRIPLALGGHPRSLKNLALQLWDGPDGAKTKDRLEVKMQKLVCANRLLLDVARKEIYWDWQKAYRTYIGPSSGPTSPVP
jgi:hypothetical protein